MDETTHPTAGQPEQPERPEQAQQAQPGYAGATGSTGPTGPEAPRPDAPHDAPRVDWEHVKEVNRLSRPADRMVAGVASGLARHFNVDPLVLRVTFAVLAFFGGAGILLYGALWLFLPEDGKAEAPIHLDERTRGFVLVVVAALAGLALLGDTWGLYWFPWPLAVIAVVAWVFLSRRTPQQQAAVAPPGTLAYAAPHPPAGWPAAPHGQQPSPTQPVQQWQPGQPAVQPAVQPAGGAPTTPVSSPVNGPSGPPPPPQQPTDPWAWAPTPPPVPPVRATRPRDPRRRGPVLFWFTLALLALAMGVLGTVDVAGQDVPGSAYPALAMTICAAMLLLGAFWGRAGGIIALGLVAALVTVVGTASERWDDDLGRVSVIPGTAAQVRDLYEMRRGELEVDLSEVSDVEALAGRDVRVEGGAGRIVLLLPDELGVDLRTEVGGPGNIRLPDGSQNGGIAVSRETSLGPDVPRMQITVELGVGEIEVVQR
ncbi:PspC domain-containing protein [Nocardioides daphniae]|uniref:PspC domain-containing protein n=1 Tax=Nocardioides daphniae TaxID=402297 RepID=A0A4P7UCP9_9ACTN|nr:PspC domain-containing protein [Nocardioides daphniae]QCC77950.1 PspC domain-containing protein [Nocardioides daphniae]GGD23702.1 hypothetical protein GCM10007231_23530 [Nocardioides daphniae]